MTDFLFWVIFCSFTQKTARKIKTLKSEKKPRDIIILHMCTKNYHQMMYGSWDMVCDGCNYFSLWPIFCPFTPVASWKIKFLKKWKKHQEISSFYIMCTKNYDQLIYGFWDKVHDGCNYFLFWAIFCPFTLQTARKTKILKKWYKHLEISSFYICVPKIMTRWCTVAKIWCVTDVIVISNFGLFFALLPP